jgi:hypothetical protein
MDFIKWFNSVGCGFVGEEQVPDNVRASLNHYLAHTNKIGIYVRKFFDEKGNFSCLSLGYYVRSRNPFKWQFHKTYGNHSL